MCTLLAICWTLDGLTQKLWFVDYKLISLKFPWPLSRRRLSDKAGETVPGRETERPSQLIKKGPISVR